MSPENSTKHLCIRCPTSADAEMSNHGKDLRQCQEEKRTDGSPASSSELWWSFQDDPEADIASFPADVTTCKEIIDYATPLATEDKPVASFKDLRITKQLLEHAAKTVQPPRNSKTIKADKKAANDAKKADIKAKEAAKQSEKIAAQHVKDDSATRAASTASHPVSIGLSADSAVQDATGAVRALNDSTTSAAPDLAGMLGNLNVGDKAMPVTGASVKPTASDSTKASDSLGDVAPGGGPVPSDTQPRNNTDVTTTSGSSDSMQRPFARHQAAEVSRPTHMVNAGALRPQAASTIATPADHIFTNHFAVSISAGQVLYEYQIVGLHDPQIKLSAPKKKVLIARMVAQSSILNRQQASFAVNNEGRVIAWQSLHTGTVENQSIEELNIDDFDRSNHNQATRQIPLDLVYKRQIRLDDLISFANGGNPTYQETGTAQAIDILVGRGVSDRRSNVVQIGDNRFFVPVGIGNVFDFHRHGMIAIRGFCSTLKPTQGGIFLNVNTGLSAFYSQRTVADYIDHYGGYARFINNARAQRHLAGLRVRILYNRCKTGEVNTWKDSQEGRIKTITGFSPSTADQINFDDRHGPTNVWKHFINTYPAAAASSRKQARQICVNTSSTIPGEECWFLSDQLEIVSGQIYRRTLDRLDPEMVADMIGFACQGPDRNKAAIENAGLQALGIQRNAPIPAVLAGAGISVSSDMLRLPFRKIAVPTIQYKGGIVTPNESAAWTTANKTFYSTSKAILGGVIFVYPDSFDISAAQGEWFIESFKKAYHKNGIHATTNIAGAWQKLDAAKMRDVVRQRPGALVVMATKNNSVQYRPQYAFFRSLMDQDFGQASIVFSVERMTKQKKGNLLPYMANNAMKINLRLGNENHTVANGFTALQKNYKCNTLVLGADLIHPKQGSAKGTPSIAALVGSVDGIFSTFLGSARKQTAGHEYIDRSNMVDMASDRIRAWQNTNKCYPDRILYYRDGTGNTQYDDIRNNEIHAIKTAWERLTNRDSKTKLQMTTVLTVKRHNTRFFPRPGEQHSTRTQNCFPGTVVDRQITSPYYFDFYLQSHDVQKGSAKPTHYVVLENEMDFDEASLQNLTNTFCYNYAHSTTAVSYPTPAYYADKLCERVSLYLRPYFDGDESLSDDEQQNERDIQNAWNRGNNNTGDPWHKNFNDKMFWM